MKKIIFVLTAIIPLIGFSQNPLFIPDTLSGSSINLSLQNGQIEFYHIGQKMSFIKTYLAVASMSDLQTK